MLKRHEIQEKRAGLIAAGKALAAKAETEKRSMSADETAELDRIAGEIEGLNAQERTAVVFEEAERRSAAEPVIDREMGRELRGYNLAKALQEGIEHRLTGREAEFHAELSRGRASVRGVMVPIEVLAGFEQRDGQTVGANADGGYLVPTALAAPADRFRPALKVESMGATVMRGLTGDLGLPNLASSGTAYWVAENGAPTRTKTTLGLVSMSPRTVAGEYKISRRLLLQAAASIDALLRKDLGFLLAQALDSAAINGSGASNQPLGLLQTAGVEAVPYASTSTALTDTAADLIGALDLDDVAGSRAFLTNPTVMNLARKVKDGEGHTIPLAELFHNERIEATTQVPKTLGAGSDKSALIYGQWSEMVLGYWSAVDILANPYHSDVASSGGVLLHAFLDADVAVRHTEAFAYSLV